MKYMLLAATAALTLAGCATQTDNDPMAKEGAPYVVTPDYDHAMVCDTRYDDLRKC